MLDPIMRRIFSLLLNAILLAKLGFAQQGKKAVATDSVSDSYSGMYSFLRDGEFVQVTVEDQGKVTGFVSRYGDLDSDKGAFLDHFFKEGKVSGTKLAFTTETVHGVWFDFKGNFERGEGKNPGDEAYTASRVPLPQTVPTKTKNPLP